MTEDTALVGLHPALADTVRIARTTVGLRVLKGVGDGRHQRRMDGLGYAVDLEPTQGVDAAAYEALAAVMFAAAVQRRCSLRWGADWNEDGARRVTLDQPRDPFSGHFELNAA